MVAAGHGFGGDKRVDDRFLRGFEEWVQVVVGNDEGTRGGSTLTPALSRQGRGRRMALTSVRPAHGGLAIATQPVHPAERDEYTILARSTPKKAHVIALRSPATKLFDVVEDDAAEGADVGDLAADPRRGEAVGRRACCRGSSGLAESVGEHRQKIAAGEGERARVVLRVGVDAQRSGRGVVVAIGSTLP